VRDGCRHLVVLLFVVVLVCGSSRADIIVLRNGQELSGRVTIEGQKARIELDIGATLVVDRGEIARTVVEPRRREVGEGAAEVPPTLLERLVERERIHRLLETLLEDDEKKRDEVEKALCEAGPRALPLVREAFVRATGQEKAHLLRVVAALGDVAAVPAVEAILRNPQERSLHREAARALVALVGPRAQWTLTDLLVGTKDPGLRTECVGLLGRMHSAYAAPFIVAALGEEGTAQKAAAVLRDWHDPVLLPFLLPRLDEGTRAAQKQAAELIAGAVTPAHAAALGRLLELYRGERWIARPLATGLQRLHNEFPVVGDVELLRCGQEHVRKAAEAVLRRLFRRRGSSPQDWATERARATAPRIALVPIGTSPAALMRELAAGVAASLRSPDGSSRAEVVVGKALEAALRAPGVVDGPGVLQALRRRQEADHRAVRVVGVCRARVWMPGRECALVGSWPGGPVVVSLFALGGDEEAVARRGRRLVLHGLARSFWVAACGDSRCPGERLYGAIGAVAAREAAASVAALDAIAARFCDKCLGQLSAVWVAEAEAAAFRYASAARRLASGGGSRALLARAAEFCERGLDVAGAMARWRAFEKAGGSAGVVARRLELLEKAERWLTKRRLVAARPRVGR